MPRDLTHVILADEMSSRLFGAARKCAEENKAAFHMGAVSHDSFLYGPKSNLSTTLHGGFGEDTRAVVTEMLDGIREEKDPAARDRKKAFAFGFLAHAAADTVFHPFVYSVAGSQVRENNPDNKSVRQANTRHRYVETWLDVYFLKEKGLDLDTFKPFKEVAQNQNKGEISKFFCESYQKAFGVKRDLTGLYEKSLAVQLLVGRVTQNQKLGRALRRLDNLLSGDLGLAVSGFYQKDRLIPEKLKKFKEFKHPVTGEIVHKSLRNLEYDAARRGADFITAAEKYIENGNKQEFLKAVPNLNLDTGIENTKLSDIKQTTPLSVDEVKGNKLAQFIKKGFKTLTSGAKAVVNKQQKIVKAAYPEVRRLAQSSVTVLRRKKEAER